MMDALLGWRLGATLNSFEQRFITDNDERYERQGATLSLSPKQWQIILSIRWKTCDRRAV